MSTIQSLGIGSGLDANSIVSQLVAIEKQPLNALKTKASTITSQQSIYGTIKSQISTLQDAATALSTAGGWAVPKATSANTAAVSVSVSATASAGSVSVDVLRLAKAQTTASNLVAPGASLGVAGDSGKLTIEIGNWSSGSFVGNGTSAEVTINGDDSPARIASKINAANAGVTASVLNNGGKEQLVIRSNATGQESGFKITSDGGFTGLNALAFTNPNNTDATLGLVQGQAGQDASVKVNGIAVSSASNTFKDVLPGVSLQVGQVTTSAVDVSVSVDTDQLQKNIQTFVDAYNAVVKTLSSATKYVQGGTSGVLQGDSTTVSLQNLLRRTISSSATTGGAYTRLADIGLDTQTDGTIKVNSSKLTTALNNLPDLQKLFTVNTGDATTNGFGVKFKDLARGLLSVDGTVSNKSASLQKALDKNSDDQQRITDRAARVEAQLKAQYSALDTKMAGISTLSSYVTAQLATWNKKSS